MDAFLQLLNQYGVIVYAILFGYCALKSGWLPLFAAYAAYTGALDVRLVALVVFAGGYLGDELRFAIAKTYGTAWVERRNRLGKLFQRAKKLADRYGPAYIFIYRYPKGLRTIGALPIGLTDMPWRRFTLLNAGSALLWVTILVGAGYSFGATFDSFGVEKLTALSVLLLIVFLISLYWFWRAESINDNQTPETQMSDVKP